MSDDKVKTTCADIVRGMGNTVREINKWPIELKITVALVDIYVWGCMVMNNKEEEYTEATYWTSPEVGSSVYGSGSSGNKLYSTENSDPEGLTGIIQKFYASDLENTINFAGTMHDVGGMAAAVTIGASRYLGVPGLVGAYGVMMVPEIVNYFSDSYNFSEFSGEAGKDVLCLLGAYGLGKFIGLFSKDDDDDDDEIQKTSTKSTKKKWTPWYERD